MLEWYFVLFVALVVDFVLSLHIKAGLDQTTKLTKLTKTIFILMGVLLVIRFALKMVKDQGPFSSSSCELDLNRNKHGSSMPCG
jgi:hypothetical protein